MENDLNFTFSFGFHSSLVIEISEAQAITKKKEIVKESTEENRPFNIKTRLFFQ